MGLASVAMALSLATTLMLVKISYTHKTFETALAGKDSGALCVHVMQGMLARR